MTDLDSGKTQNCCALSVMEAPVGSELRRRIEELCGEDVMKCYQCGECTAGCPVAFAMDISPNQILRMAQLGLENEVLSSASIWLCAGCETCATRCPKGVALSRVMDACRQLAVERGIRPKEPGVAKFHDQFLKEIQRFGRVHELSLTAFYKLRTRDFFSDVFTGVQMFLKGKLALIPSIIKGRGDVRKLFSRLRKPGSVK
ncbi:MAG: 4Fe-4S dicluster domain-containing protein [Armatimonadota bacterium]